jgi:SAM-dependent methyltransferase
VAFKDYFSKQADKYTQYRPRYPRELFEFLASLPARRDSAWDCGTGNGQAAAGLAEFFAEVIGTDASAEQIAHSQRHERVRYIVSSAEDCPLADGSVDLVTVAQALHWFDRERFYAQVRRVSRPGGVLAFWSYGLATISRPVDRVVWHLYSDLLGAYWPAERLQVEERYDTIPFPFEEVKPPQIAMTAQWNLADLIGYLGTWSSVQRFNDVRGTDPVDLVRSDLAAAWGPSEANHTVTWPLNLRVGRVG